MRRSGGWGLLVASTDREIATAQLETYDEEDRDWREDRVGAVDYGPTYAGIAMSLLLVAFYLITGPRDAGVSWFRSGSASAELILQGEIWRTVTALTLHADVPHVLANALASALFVTAVCRSVGPGVGSLLVVLAGAGGNAVNALFHGSHHDAVGASTAIFGAVGILGGLQFARKRRLGAQRRRVWSPLIAAVALLAMLGTGERTDVLAHLFGFLVGGGLGVAGGLALQRPPSSGVQGALGVGAAAAVAGCWLLAVG